MSKIKCYIYKLIGSKSSQFSFFSYSFLYVWTPNLFIINHY
uniref:Uncharacterized protein n=1 Tax=Anguilla anguilla TaxID=7936 RepID=A0A0E9QX79_ANGAN